MAAVLGEIAQQIIHRAVFGRIDQRTAFTVERHEFCLLELVQVERQGRRWQPEPLPDPPSRQAVNSGLDQQVKDIEPGILCEGAEGSNGV